MAFGYIANVNAYNVGAGTTLDGVGTLNIAAGDLLIGCAGWEASATDCSMAESGGGNAFTMRTRASHGTVSNHFQIGYKIAASANSSATMRLTTNAAAEVRNFIVFQFRPDVGDTVSLDSGGDGNVGTSQYPVSDDINTEGTDEVIVAGQKAYTSRTTTLEKIAETAADLAVDISGYGSGWYNIFAEAKTGKHAQLDYDSSTYWSTDIVAFKAIGSEVTWTPHVSRTMVFS
jgi:hypothetical protein